jgi:hypothetical protein
MSSTSDSAALRDAPAAPRFTPRQVRLLGSVLCVIGPALAIGMALILWNTAPTMLHPGQSIGGTVFNGTTEQGTSALRLFASVLLFGLAATGAGVHQVRTGRRDVRVLTAVFVVLAIVLYCFMDTMDRFV